MAAQYGLGLKAILAGAGVGFAGGIWMENCGFSGSSQATVKHLTWKNENLDGILDEKKNVSNMVNNKGPSCRIDEATMRAKFEQFMAEHNRIYKNAAEKERRYKLFKENVESVESHNNSGQSWKMRVTHLADRTPEEWRKFMKTLCGERTYEDMRKKPCQSEDST